MDELIWRGIQGQSIRRHEFACFRPVKRFETQIDDDGRLTLKESDSTAMNLGKDDQPVPNGPEADRSGQRIAATRMLGSQASIVFAGTVFTFLVGLPFQIYLARQLGVTSLGMVGIAEAFTQLLAGVLSFGMAPLAVRYIPEYRVSGDSAQIKRLIVLGLVTLSGFGLLGAVLLPWIAALLPESAGVNAEILGILSVLGWVVPISLVVFFLSQALRGFEEIKMVVFATSILALSAKVVLSVGLFLSQGASPITYAYAIVISQALVVAPLAWALWRCVRGLPSGPATGRSDWRGWLSFAATNYSGGLVSNVVSNLDRIVIGGLLGPAAVGVLMIARQLQQFPAVFHKVVLTVASPVFAKLKAARDMEGLAHQLHLTNDWILRMAAGMLLFLMILPDYVLDLYGAEFAQEGTVLLITMTLAVAVHVGGGPVGVLMNMTGYHGLVLRVSLLSAVIVLGGYFLFIPLFGVVGAGIAVLLGDIFSKLVIIAVMQRQHGIMWYDPRFRRWMLPAGAATAVLLAARLVLPESGTLALQAAGLIAAAVLAYAAFFAANVAQGLHEDDRALLKMVRDRLARTRRQRTTKA